ncbi:FIT family protein scs3 [Escovopsis weberi]|uniref:FIT family protein scs3 n=1 Tax=Escovopsis weberi TaxID=150374 RepID=A0A0M8MTC5_ESCWE|nr:FIT family protein scs3 [Escovopsis weberi]
MAAADDDRNARESTPHRGNTTTTTTTRTRTTTSSLTPTTTTPPHLPTPIETIALGMFPFILIFGAIFSVLSPHTRSAPYDAVTQSHSQDPNLAPSYFARKNNIFNVFFVKRGWAWTTLAFVFALLTQPAGRAAAATSPAVVLARRARAGLRWALTTTYWVFVTQWFFGPPLIDRSFRLTGGRCEMAAHAHTQGEFGVEMVTSVACKTAGGRWKGGHDISGHVFLLVLGTAFLMHEVGWPMLVRSRRRAEERCIVAPDGTVEKIGRGAPADGGPEDGREGVVLGVGEKAAVAVICMNLWMLLMTAIYFHTWVEKFTGLLTAMLQAI